MFTFLNLNNVLNISTIYANTNIRLHSDLLDHRDKLCFFYRLI